MQRLLVAASVFLATLTVSATADAFVRCISFTHVHHGFTTVCSEDGRVISIIHQYP